ncbi:MAG: serine protease [Candidatus Marinimicrobia bacterium]|nr:serine protease [Candidatus Neomarinimicrobiota bacterium]
MKKYKFIKLALFLISITLLFSSCNYQMKKKGENSKFYNYYNSSFNFAKSNMQTEEIFSSIKIINSIAFYKTSFFSLERKIKKVTPENFKNDVVGDSYDTKTSSGTASIIYNNNNKLALLTCTHIVDFPDTIYGYYESNNQKYISSISIKERQDNYINDLIDGNKLEVIISDSENDIAILTKKTSPTIDKYRHIVLKHDFCDVNKISPGLQIYIFGYPKNKKIITQGIIGNIEKNNYLIDSQFNRGQSGGMVFVTRADYPNFELLGMGKSSLADFHLLLTPNDNYVSQNYKLTIPYRDEIYLKNISFINYGLTNVIPIKYIRNFIKENKKALEKKGYDMNYFFK